MKYGLLENLLRPDSQRTGEPLDEPLVEGPLFLLSLLQAAGPRDNFCLLLSLCHRPSSAPGGERESQTFDTSGGGHFSKAGEVDYTGSRG